MEAQELTEFLVAQFATFRAEYRDDNKRLHDRIDAVCSELKEVRIQTTKTNGRVNGLELHTKTCPVISVIKDVEANTKDILEIKAKEEIKSSDEYKSGRWLRQTAVVAGYIVGISALFGGIIWLKDLL